MTVQIELGSFKGDNKMAKECWIIIAITLALCVMISIGFKPHDPNAHYIGNGNWITEEEYQSRTATQDTDTDTEGQGTGVGYHFDMNRGGEYRFGPHVGGLGF
jgi:hypothetical protein